MIPKDTNQFFIFLIKFSFCPNPDKKIRIFLFHISLWQLKFLMFKAINTKFYKKKNIYFKISIIYKHLNLKSLILFTSEIIEPFLTIKIFFFLLFYNNSYIIISVQVNVKEKKKKSLQGLPCYLCFLEKHRF